MDLIIHLYVILYYTKNTHRVKLSNGLNRRCQLMFQILHRQRGVWIVIWSTTMSQCFMSSIPKAAAKAWWGAGGMQWGRGKFYQSKGRTVKGSAGPILRALSISSLQPFHHSEPHTRDSRKKAKKLKGRISARRDDWRVWKLPDWSWILYLIFQSLSSFIKHLSTSILGG